MKLDQSNTSARYFLPYQVEWIEAETPFHERSRPVFALAEKSVRVGWTYADAFKNVRKRLRFKKRDYLFATKDYPSALEYMRLCFMFAEIYDLTRSILSHGEDYLQVPRLDPEGQPTGFTDEIKIGLIKFDNGSRIIAFSSSPRAMAVHAGDVGLDEFAKHPNARLLWETAQGRVTWGFDLAIWSAHDGQDTLFHQFAREARLSCSIPPKHTEASSPTQTTPPQSKIESQKSKISSPWNIYFRVTIADAIQFGLLDVINRVQGARFTPDQFLSDCRARAGSDEIFQQTYMCNPMGSAAANIVEWSAIERCRSDYEIERVHLEASQIQQHFGEFSPNTATRRESQIHDFLRSSFPSLFEPNAASSPKSGKQKSGRHSAPGEEGPKFKNPRLGFDVAASGQGDLAVIYIDEAREPELWLRALFTARTEDWHFLKTVLFTFLKHLRRIRAAGDETGLGRQICWEAASQFPGRFQKVNFTSTKNDLGFALMNQLSIAEKRFPRSQQDIAADFFALRKLHNGTRWVFKEATNTLNPASHCDIAWAAALASYAHASRRCEVGCAVADDNCWFDGKDYHPYTKGGAHHTLSAEHAMLLSDDPRIWRPLA